MKLLFYIFLYVLPLTGFGQIHFSWKEQWSKPAGNSVFAVDQYNNLYYTYEQVLYKIDSTGKERFKQSIKNWSDISFIDARNPMKIMLFSEDQQLVEYLDNTLAKQQDIIDLTGEGFSFATKVVTSAQPDKIWVFDSDNSRIVLYTRQVAQQQRIDNIFGLLNAKMILQMLEYNSQLYLVDPTKGIFVLDRYGTMLDFISLEKVRLIQIENDILYYLVGDDLFFMHLKDKFTEKITLPLTGIKYFFKNENKFYFQTDKEIKLFSFENRP